MRKTVTEGRGTVPPPDIGRLVRSLSPSSPFVRAEPGEAWRRLLPFSTESRINRIEEVIGSRCAGLVLVLDNLHDSHNLSAILRTAESLGLQYVFLSGTIPSGLNPRIVRGAHGWITLRRAREPEVLCRGLKDAGYTIAASVLSEGALSPGEYGPRGATALVVGNEHKGVSSFWRESADTLLRIPLPGFTRSLNVSVAAGIMATRLLDKPAIRSIGMPPEEKTRLKDLWIKRSVPNAARILAGIRSGKEG